LRPRPRLVLRISGGRSGSASRCWCLACLLADRPGAAARPAGSAGRGSPRPRNAVPSPAPSVGPDSPAACPLPEDEPNWRSIEAELGSELILQEAPIAEMDLIGVASEEDERRRRNCDLGRVEDLGRAELAGRGRLAERRGPDDAVELRRRDALATLTPHVHRQLQDVPDALAGLGTDRHKRSEVQERNSPRMASTYSSNVRPVFSTTRSHLFRAMTRPRPSSATKPATWASWAVSPSKASTTRTATSARSTALRARSVE